MKNYLERKASICLSLLSAVLSISVFLLEEGPEQFRKL